MTFIELTSQHKEIWNKIAAESDDAWFFHAYEWLALSERVWGFESKSFLIEYEGKVIGIMPLQLNPRSKNLKSTYMGLGGTALINGLDGGVRTKVLKATHEHIRQIAQAHQSPSIDIAVSPLTPAVLRNPREINPLIHYFYEDVSTHTWMVDLTQSEEEIFGHYADDARRSIKKAQASGYTVAPVTDLQGMERYFGVRCETAERNGIETHPREYFDEIYRNFFADGRIAVWEAKDRNGESVAFEVTVFCKEAALYWMGCCKTAHLNSGINYLLQHHAMMWAKARGGRWFENGEAFPNAREGKLRGLTLFKGKFGGELHRFLKGRMDCRNPETPNVFKDWVHASISLLKPVVKEEGVEKIERTLGKSIKGIKKVKARLDRVSYLKPYWRKEEFQAGLSYRDEGTGAFVDEMIAAFKEKLDIGGSVFPTSSGRSALELALKVIKANTPDKDKIIVTTYGCRGVYDPVVNAGFQPLFADINPELNLSVECVAELAKREEKIAAVVVPHLCGKPEDIDLIAALAKDKRWILIEDVCQSLGGRSRETALGAQYDMSIFSFGMGKNLMATSGGVLASRIYEKNLAAEYAQMALEDTAVVKARFRKIVLKYFLGVNVDLQKEISSGYRFCRMHPLDAKLITLQLDKLKEIIERQRANAREIIEALKRTNLKLRLQNSPDHIYSKLALIFEDEASCVRLDRALQRELVETEEMYTPLHLRDFSKEFTADLKLKNAENIYRYVFNIPVRPNLSRAEIERIKRAICHADA